MHSVCCRCTRAKLAASPAPCAAEQGRRRLHVVTVATDAAGATALLESAAASACAAPVVLGQGASKARYGSSGGFKIEALTAWARAGGGGVRDDDLVLFVDAYDVVLAQGVRDTIADRFAAANASVVFSAEAHSWPDASVGATVVGAATAAPYPHLNSGAFVGTFRAVKRLLEATSRDVERHGLGDVRDADDQRWFTRRHLADPTGVQVDTHATMFLSLHGVDKGSLRARCGAGAGAGVSVVHRLPLPRGGGGGAETRPAVLHGNGGGKALFRELAAADAECRGA